MKILYLDIETAPNLAYVWGLWKENISTAQIANNGYVLCWAAKWDGQKDVMFDSVNHSRGPKRMLAGVHKLLNEADVVVHYNGKSFDIPTLNKEFVQQSMTPPSPYQQIDLYRVVKEVFRFPSNKLDYVLKTLGLGEKVRHPGFEMWVGCMSGDDESWEKMETYNKHDVKILEVLYHRILPWIRNHPNRAAFDGGETCPKCGSNHYQRRGFTVSRQSKYQRLRCLECGTWFREISSIKQELAYTSIGQ